MSTPLRTPAFSDAPLSARRPRLLPCRPGSHEPSHPAATRKSPARMAMHHRSLSRPPLLQGFGLRLHLSDIRRRFTSAQVTPDSLRPFPDPPSVSPPRVASRRVVRECLLVKLTKNLQLTTGEGKGVRSKQLFSSVRFSLQKMKRF